MTSKLTRILAFIVVFSNIIIPWVVEVDNIRFHSSIGWLLSLVLLAIAEYRTDK